MMSKNEMQKNRDARCNLLYRDIKKRLEKERFDTCLSSLILIMADMVYCCVKQIKIIDNNDIPTQELIDDFIDSTVKIIRSSYKELYEDKQMKEIKLKKMN